MYIAAHINQSPKLHKVDEHDSQNSTEDVTNIQITGDTYEERTNTHEEDTKQGTRGHTSTQDIALTGQRVATDHMENERTHTAFNDDNTQTAIGRRVMKASEKWRLVQQVCECSTQVRSAKSGRWEGGDRREPASSGRIELSRLHYNTQQRLFGRQTHSRARQTGEARDSVTQPSPRVHGISGGHQSRCGDRRTPGRLAGPPECDGTGSPGSRVSPTRLISSASLSTARYLAAVPSSPRGASCR